MKKYVCDVCGYVYDPDQGDEEGGIPPERRLRSFPPIGPVRFAAPIKASSSRNRRFFRKG